MKTFKFIFFFIWALLLLFSSTAFSRGNDKTRLREDIRKISDSLNASVGVAIEGLDFQDTLSFNGNKHFPMQSVFKFPLAIYILNEVDKGQLSLHQKIHIAKEQLDTNTWSPLVKDFPDQNIDITLSDLLIYTVSKSDNNGCDVLFHLAGGTGKVNKYIHELGIRNIAITATEAEMKKAWNVQYTNWCAPSAMLRLLRLFHEGKVLSKAGHDFLMKIMTESINSPHRIKGLLPASTIVAHKTGTSNTNIQGITAATNDVGIITLPNGHHYAIVVFVSDYQGGVARGEHVIAGISKLVWDYLK